jgi:regulator of RNase E activity RraA
MTRLRRFPSAEQIAPEVVAALREIPAAILSDNLGGLVGTANIRGYHRPEARMAGTAVTVRVRPGDNLVLHRALDYVRPGDVLLVDCNAHVGQAVTGKIMCRYLETIGAAGIVIDGSIRGAREISERAFPVFARGTTPRGPYKSGPGEINVPIVIDGMAVSPGDIVVGDEDGVVAFSKCGVEDLIARATAQRDKEAKGFHALLAGKWDRSWIEKEEKKHGLA